MTCKAVIEKVILFPAIKGGVERQRKGEIPGPADWDLVQKGDLLEDAFVVGQSYGGRFMADGPEILFAEILHPDEPLVGVVVVDFGDLERLAFKEIGDLDVMAVFFAQMTVMDEDLRFARADVQTVEFAIRSPFFNEGGGDRLLLKLGKTEKRLLEKEIRDHE